jgi:translation initiation factor IF-2
VTTKKKRIHELAKELGLPAQTLVAKLQTMGFSEVKGPQSALDEFTLLSVQGRLEAYGIVAKPNAPEAASLQTGGLTVRKKKKRTSVDSAPDAEEEPAAEPEVIEAASSVVEAPPPAPAIRPAKTEPAPEVRAQPAELPRTAPERHHDTPSTVEVQPAAALHREAGRGAALEETVAPARPVEAQHPQTVEELPEAEYTPSTDELGAIEIAPEEWIEAEPESDRDMISPAARTSAPPPRAPEPVEPAEAPRPSRGASPSPAGAKAAPEDLVKPAQQRRPGKVVGFVDLSKVQAQQRPQTQSRKLKSKDDVAPSVQPTFGNDRKRALVRGDHAQRGSLTASQLREKESSRFLRRRGAPAGAPGAPKAAGGARAPAVPAGTSPMSGTEVTIEAPVTVKKLADALSVKASQVLTIAMTQYGLGININSVLESDTATTLAEEFSVTLKVSETLEAEQVMREKLVQARGQVDDASLERRPATIAFLGHVDHGKTTLLDTIRDSRIAKGESGGITQHIGAYQVTTKSGHLITILDTPGHEAFTAMRARGAQAVDIVVLVVAADDGVMPSTIEAIAHAKAANVPIVVALNKSDKPEANPERVKQQLTKHDLLAEDYGGQVGMISVSATKNTGVDELLERVVIESELLELKSHNAGAASGVVLEAEVQEGKGRVAFLLVKEGTLSQGDVILAGEGYGKVRSIHDDRDRAIKTAGPSMPVQVSGLSELPGVGDQFHVVPSLEEARGVAEERARKNRMMSLAERRAVTSESLGQALSDQHKKTVNVVLKADVQGSLEALKAQIEGLTHSEVDVRLLHSALGTVTENDVNLAASSSAAVLAFHVGVNEKARVAADRTGVDIRPYEVIYEMLDDLRGMMEGTLAPEVSEQIVGHVEVRALFKSSKFGSVAGSHVIDGSISRDSKVRVLRGKSVVFTGQIAGLRREKDDVKEVREGFDCGVTLKDFDAYEIGDVIEAFKMVTTKRLLKI